MSARLRIGDEWYEGEGKVRVTAKGPSESVFYGDSTVPRDLGAIELSTSFHCEFEDRAAFERFAAPRVSLEYMRTTFRVRRRLARLGWLIRRPRGRRLLRVVIVTIRITIPRVRFGVMEPES